MPNYEFACPSGHRVERFYRMSDDIPVRVRCRCRKLARRVYSTIRVSRGACAFEPHYNVCLDEVVTSERHMKDVEARLYGERGIKAVPYEKVRERPADWLEKGAASHRGAELANAQTEELIPGDGVPEGGGWGREFEGEEGEAVEVTA